MKNREWWTPKQAADYLGVSVSAIHNWAAKGLIKSYRVGTLLKFEPEDVKAFVVPNVPAAA